ncbi:hypothetical protein C9974_03975 [Marinobacter sp. B9-2]|nr:hypothetical protein C9974_03975 [Marinobacter sp. B9-2]
MYINSVKVAVRAHTPDGNKDFGFLFEFQEGLNVLTGDNSSGKSTVLSCIYYCLGLEQLIGSKGVNALSPALHQALMSDGYSCNIYESECFLEFTDKAGKKWSLNRVVKDGETVGSNEIIIEANGEKMSKFIHSPRDHSRNGFFKWFAEVNELDIFDVESTSGLSAKPLYMQNVFTLCFIEQTKGWSDFFSMMPPFGIKDPKQKVVEYCLGLNSLAVNMQLDAIKVGKDSIVEKWREQIKELDLRAQNLNLYLSPIDKLKPKTKRQIEKIYFFQIMEGDKELGYDSLIIRLDEKIDSISSSISKFETSQLRSAALISENDSLKISLNRYISERKEIEELFWDESHKLSRYQDALNHVINDLQDFKDINKVSIGRGWNRISSAHCPVCDSEVSNLEDSRLTDSSIKKSLAFLNSQKATYQKYIKGSKKVLNRYQATLDYYDKSIALKRGQIDSLHKDLESAKAMSYRSEFQMLAERKQRKIELETFDLYLRRVKEDLISLSHEFYELVEEEKRLKNLVSSDEDKIRVFKSDFKILLESFGYRSNGLDNVDIKGKDAHRLFPSVYISGQEPQYIRYVSSASDFVRSIWAYYIALLLNGVRHPGFLVMDEPGQHQMRVDSMKSLLKTCSSLSCQTIIAISQDRKYDQENVNIHDLVSELEEGTFKLMHIDDGSGCIARLDN